ncbi:hypothetical protein DUNSADRAFT_1746 [Dunaliella salina]|uniref:Encoded protein n=1 Tax=Dunaliella salina TaxID=3046 RepID=A0ABQ7GWR3_DUNSA|nr:hypothetical protein DUNSADRAFT_1746 [Dunaliella salina]|eukprot:KAF5839049.1 hypothetical protein DUNSADRAFT_1746 [Dunaliella salina]
MRCGQGHQGHTTGLDTCRKSCAAQNKRMCEASGSKHEIRVVVPQPLQSVLACIMYPSMRPLRLFKYQAR